MGHKIAVIGGDARYIELIRQLKTLPDATIYLIGYDKLEPGFTGLTETSLTELKISELDAVILPVTGTDKTGMVESVFSEKPIQLNDNWFGQLKDSALIFTGITSPFLNTVTTKYDLSLIALFDRDDVAIYNSIPTAEGTIMMAIEHTDYTIHSSHVMVVGFGRVGHTVANKFSALGANVSVSARSIKDLARVSEMGIKAIPLESLEDEMANCDLLINTVPSLVITKQLIQQLPAHAIIFDLASKPGGTDFDYAKQRGIKAILARSLPGIVAPKTSGKILAEVIIQILLKRKEVYI